MLKVVLNRVALALVLSGGLFSSAQGQALAGPQPDADAKQLAGMATWEPQAVQGDRLWADLDRNRLKPMRDFAAKEFGAERNACETLFYPFGGPDLLNALTLFPTCKSYVLFGLEPVGKIPDTSKLSPAELAQVRGAMAHAQEYLVRRNFFVTQYMGKDLRSPHLTGVLPLLSVMLARQGYEVRAVERLSLTGEAEATSGDARAAARAVRIRFIKQDKEGAAAEQTVEYYNFDASVDGLARRDDFLKRATKMGKPLTLLKAASYLLHDSGFSKMRELVLHSSKLIVQDDTGVPYRELLGAGMTVELRGHYDKPIHVFAYRYQPDLHKAYKQGEPREDLPFAWSYNAERSKVGLQIARPSK